MNLATIHMLMLTNHELSKNHGMLIDSYLQSPSLMLKISIFGRQQNAPKTFFRQVAMAATIHDTTVRPNLWDVTWTS